MLRYLILGFGRLRARRHRQLLRFMMEEDWDQTAEFAKVAAAPLLGDELEIDTLALDLNGTLTIEGTLVAGTIDELRKILAADVRVIITTGDVRGTATSIFRELEAAGIITELVICKDGRGTSLAKLARLLELGVGRLAYIGSGQGDALAVRTAAFSIAMTQSELSSSDTVTGAVGHATSITHALAGLLDEKLMRASFHQ